jgi:hypothetical protein
MRAVHIAQAAGTMRPADTEGLASTMQGAHITGLAAAIGEAVTGIRTMDIPGSAITAWAMALHITGLAITVTAPVDAMIRTTDIIRVDTTLTATDTRRTLASASGSTAIKLSEH